MSISSHPRKKRGTYTKPSSTQEIFSNTKNNIPESEFLDYTDGDMNHTLLSTNMDDNITDPEFLAHLARDTNQALECMK